MTQARLCTFFCPIFVSLLTYNRLVIAKVGLTSHFRNNQAIVGQDTPKTRTEECTKSSSSRHYNLLTL